MVGFEVLRKLADGSAAEVFLARDESSLNRVVLEVIRPELLTDMEVYGRFLDEAKVRQGLKHPNLLRRQSTGCGKDGRLFVVTEPVAGEHLGSVLQTHGPMKVDSVIRLMLPICDALAYLHGRGLIHGNLRPANIFLGGSSRAPTPKLLDTGLSLFRSTRSVTNPAVRVLVEPEYLSPERVRGMRATVASDIYGMGVLMFEMLSGRAPFSSSDPSMTRRGHLESEPPALPARAERLGPIVNRCLAKNPARRFANVLELKLALTRHLGEGSPASVSVSLSQAPTAVRTGLTPPPPPPLDKTVRTPPPPKLPPEEPIESLSADSMVVSEPVGEVLGSYELLDMLGQGGMGRVFLARHVKLGRKVALKILKQELASDPTQLQRFFQEGQAVNRISHPHIVEIYDFVEAANGPTYFVMEALAGQTLREAIKKEPLRLPRATKIVRQVCQALSAAHAVGVVHRDIKPDNIFLTHRQGEPDFVKVLDFGVAKLKASAEGANLNATRAGVVLGTPSYMAPEQALGEVVDHRADVYSLVTVLYTMLSGKPPFQATSLGPLMARVVTQPPPPLPERSAAGDVIPDALRAVLDKGLAKKPQDRYQSMDELAEALAPFERANPSVTLPALPTAPPLPARDQPRPSWPQMVLAAGVALALLAIAGLLLLGSGHETMHSPIVPSEVEVERHADPQPGAAPTFKKVLVKPAPIESDAAEVPLAPVELEPPPSSVVTPEIQVGPAEISAPVEPAKKRRR